MQPSDRELLTLGPWPTGANNLALETSVPNRSFRRGMNVDVTDDGKVVRRDGRTLIIEADGPHDLFGYGNRGFFALDQTLYGFELVDGNATAAVALYTDLRVDARLAHALIDPDIFVSDGNVSLRITPSGEVLPWTLPTPPDPVLTTVAGGLVPGRYHVAYAYKGQTGEESPLSEPVAIDVAEGQGITIAFTYLVPGLRTSVYMTKPDGGELLHVATVPGQPPSMNVFKQNLGRPSPTEGTDPMPAGNFSALWNGRLLVGAENMVYWSEPMMYGLTKLAYNYLVLAESVTGIAATETGAGFFVGQQSRTYHARGTDPSDAALHEAYPAGIVPGTVQYIPGARLPLDPPPAEMVPMWLATNGVFCVGMPDGTVFPLSETRYATMHASEGAALFDQRAGKNRYIASLKNPSENSFALTDAFSAEVIRNGN